LPITRRKYIAEDSEAKFVVVNADAVEESTFSKDVILNFPPAQELDQYDGRFSRKIDPNLLSYLLYTSGNYLD
jgi:hypothetical protein